jgi:hypothetical protein
VNRHDAATWRSLQLFLKLRQLCMRFSGSLLLLPLFDLSQLLLQCRMLFLQPCNVLIFAFSRRAARLLYAYDGNWEATA